MINTALFFVDFVDFNIILTVKYKSFLMDAIYGWPLLIFFAVDILRHNGL